MHFTFRNFQKDIIQLNSVFREDEQPLRRTFAHDFESGLLFLCQCALHTRKHNHLDFPPMQPTIHIRLLCAHLQYDARPVHVASKHPETSDAPLQSISLFAW